MHSNIGCSVRRIWRWGQPIFNRLMFTVNCMTRLAKQHFEQAGAAFASCIAQGDKAPLDQILHEDVIAKNCQPDRRMSKKH